MPGRYRRHRLTGTGYYKIQGYRADGKLREIYYHAPRRNRHAFTILEYMPNNEYLYIGTVHGLKRTEAYVRRLLRDGAGWERWEAYHKLPLQSWNKPAPWGWS